jgi:small subunit ribosomal protein S17
MSLKEKIGTVVSDRMEGTRIVAVIERGFHKKYKKVRTVRKKYAVCDVGSKAFMGDLVCIRETRPISKTKRWVLVKIFKKSSL